MRKILLIIIVGILIYIITRKCMESFSNSDNWTEFDLNNFKNSLNSFINKRDFYTTTDLQEIIDAYKESNDDMDLFKSKLPNINIDEILLIDIFNNLLIAKITKKIFEENPEENSEDIVKKILLADYITKNIEIKDFDKLLQPKLNQKVPIAAIKILLDHYNLKNRTFDINYNQFQELL